MVENYFDWFDIPVSHILDTAYLRQLYLKKSKALHPDLQQTHTAINHLELTAKNNAAYKTLLDPQLRLAHVLQLHGKLGEERTGILDPTFLMEMMELHESIETAIAAKNNSKITALRKTLDQTVEHILNQLVAANTNQYSEEDLNTMEVSYYKIKYCKRISDHLDQIAPEQ